MIAVNDGKVVKLGTSKRLGRYVILQDVYGNTYTYAGLGSVAKTYPSPKKRTSKKDSDTGAKRRGLDHEGTADAKAAGRQGRAEPAELAAPGRQGPPVRPPGAQERQGRRRRRPADRRGRHRGAGLRRRPARPEPEGLRRQAARQGRPRPRRHHARPHRQDVSETVAPHLLFEIRPAGRGAPRIDPKPILDGWKLLESTEVYRAKGKNALFGSDAEELSIGQIMLMGKETARPQGPQRQPHLRSTAAAAATSAPARSTAA